MKCNWCGREARIALVKDDAAWDEFAYCQECWELGRLAHEILELARRSGVKEQDYPAFFEALSACLHEWRRARCVDLEILALWEERRKRAEELSDDPNWQLFKRLVDSLGEDDSNLPDTE